MPLVVSDDGLIAKVAGVAYAINNVFLPTFHLFKNDIHPDKNTVIGDFVECDFDGYAPIQTIANWVNTGTAGHVTAIAPISHPIFTNLDGSNPNPIYGYYVADGAGTVLYWSERDPAAPRIMSVPGTTYEIVPQMTDESKFG